jgi:hypothetical protein
LLQRLPLDEVLFLDQVILFISKGSRGFSSSSLPDSMA